MGHLFSVYGLLALLAGYLLGSIPFGLILTRAAGLGDVRRIGSGNIGATNVLRTGRKGLAAATLVLDALKGTIAVLIVYAVAVRWAGGADAIIYCHIAGLGAFLGHIYPVWLRFQGGKGVATYIGVLIGMHWPAALWFGIVWIGVALGTRYSSLAALSATAGVVLYYLVTGWAGLGVVLVMSALVFLKHHANIRRLLEGRESKIGAKS
ncbi:MAG: glycerol-3-phosphate 1-O-acyltransferase PlsY [Hyphomonadaceae bacterium]|jgi:glycerol-3-phosphate acyltransferase PlsY|nr:glycerol-3-phosphate 1-O-acyltransferase PlsY [Hyphomonadaceae bacterium]